MLQDRRQGPEEHVWLPDGVLETVRGVGAIGCAYGGGGHDQGYRPRGVPQFSQMTEGGSGRGLSRDQVVLPIPAAQRGNNGIEPFSIVIDDQYQAERAPCR